MLSAVTGCSVGGGNTPETTVSTTSNVVRVTFPEGSTVSQIAILLEENGVCSAADFMAEANNPLNLEGFGFEIPDQGNRAFLLEGYLFPDTYDMYIGESTSSVIKRFLENFNERWTDEYKKRAEELGLTTSEVLTIASIIQKEAAIDASNVMYVHKGKATRIGFKMDGDKKVRIAKATGDVID